MKEQEGLPGSPRYYVVVRSPSYGRESYGPFEKLSEAYLCINGIAASAAALAAVEKEPVLRAFRVEVRYE